MKKKQLKKDGRDNKLTFKMSDVEYRALKKQAGSLTLSAYVRQILFYKLTIKADGTGKRAKK